ncbi:hypothetical protein ACRRTK_024240 [Alexandromys fortis]
MIWLQACGGLEWNVVVWKKMDPTGRDFIMMVRLGWSRYSLVGTMSLLGKGFEVSCAQAMPSVAACGSR